MSALDLPLVEQVAELERKWERGHSAASPLFRELLALARRCLPEQVGTGRRHGHVPPVAATMERRLYDATHHDTYWENPEPGDVAELIAWYVTLPGCSSGGSLHIAVEDHNLDDSHLQWCAGYAFGVGDTCGDELAGLLERMDVWNRVEAVRLADELRAAAE